MSNTATPFSPARFMSTLLAMRRNTIWKMYWDEVANPVRKHPNTSPMSGLGRAGRSRCFLENSPGR